VGDLALFDAVITGNLNAIRPAPLRGVKLGVARGYFFADLDAEVECITNAALRKLQDVGVELVEAEVADLADLIQKTTLPIANHDLVRTLPKYLENSGANLTLDQLVALASPAMKARFPQLATGGRSFVTEEIYRAACDLHLPKLRENFRDYFGRTGVAAIVFPTTMTTAAVIGQSQVTIADKKVSFAAAMSRNIAPGSTAGLPGLVLPAGLTPGGLPVSLEFDGPSGTDLALLALGLSAEGVLGRLPPPKV
jgi:indoleacetamide hydrolase